jgi:subtilisin family serine protease
MKRSSGFWPFVQVQGIYAAHEEFLSYDGASSRILGGFSMDGAAPATDCNGHGTHISGTAAGRYYGVAKAAYIHPCAPAGNKHTHSLSILQYLLESLDIGTLTASWLLDCIGDGAHHLRHICWPLLWLCKGRVHMFL